MPGQNIWEQTQPNAKVKYKYNSEIHLEMYTFVQVRTIGSKICLVNTNKIKSTNTNTFENTNTNTFEKGICCQVRTIRSNSSGDTKWNHVLIVAKIFLIMGENTNTNTNANSNNNTNANTNTNTMF